MVNMGEKRNARRDLVRKPEGNIPTSRLGLDWKILLQCILKRAASVVLAFSTQVRGVQTRPKPSDFLGRKNPKHAFLRRGSKAVGPMS